MTNHSVHIKSKEDVLRQLFGITVSYCCKKNRVADESFRGYTKLNLALSKHIIPLSLPEKKADNLHCSSIMLTFFHTCIENVYLKSTYI